MQSKTLKDFTEIKSQRKVSKKKMELETGRTQDSSSLIVLDMPKRFGVVSRNQDHKIASTILKEYFKNTVRAIDGLEEILAPYKGSKDKTEKCMFRIYASGQILIATICPVSIHVYKSICRSWFSILLAVTGADSYEYFIKAVDKSKTSRQKIHKDRMEWAMSHIDPHFFKLLVSKLKMEGNIRAVKYNDQYSVPCVQKPNMSNRQENDAVRDINRFVKNINKAPDENFTLTHIIQALGIPAHIAIRVGESLLMDFCRLDDRLSNPRRKADLENILEQYRNTVITDGFLERLRPRDSFTAVKTVTLGRRFKEKKKKSIPVSNIGWGDMKGHSVISMAEINNEQQRNDQIEEIFNCTTDTLDSKEIITDIVPYSSMSHTHHIIDTALKMYGSIDIKSLLKTMKIKHVTKNDLDPTVFDSLSEDQKNTVMKTPYKGFFTALETKKSIGMNIHMQRMVAAAALGEFDTEKDDRWIVNVQSVSRSLKNTLCSKFCTSSGISYKCPRGNACLVEFWARIGKNNQVSKLVSCWELGHKNRLEKNAEEWGNCIYQIGNKLPVDMPDILLEPYFIPVKLRDKIRQKLEFQQDLKSGECPTKFMFTLGDFNNGGKPPSDIPEPNTMKIWRGMQRVYKFAFKSIKEFFIGQEDFKNFRAEISRKKDEDYVYRRVQYVNTEVKFRRGRAFTSKTEDNEYGELRAQYENTEIMFKQRGIYLAWLEKLLNASKCKIRLKYITLDAEKKSVDFAKSMKPFLNLIRWGVIRLNRLPNFFFEYDDGKFNSAPRMLSKRELEEVYDMLSMSKMTQQFTDQEFKIFNQDNDIILDPPNEPKAEDKEKVFVPKNCKLTWSDGDSTYRYCRNNNIVPELFDSKKYSPVVNVLKNDRLFGQTSNDEGTKRCYLCSYHYFSNEELHEHEFGMRHMQCYINSFKCPEDCYAAYDAAEKNKKLTIAEKKSGTRDLSLYIDNVLIQDSEISYDKLDNEEIANGKMTDEEKKKHIRQKFGEMFEIYEKRALAAVLCLRNCINYFKRKLVLGSCDSTPEDIHRRRLRLSSTIDEMESKYRAQRIVLKTLETEKRITDRLLKEKESDKKVHHHKGSKFTHGNSKKDYSKTNKDNTMASFRDNAESVDKKYSKQKRKISAIADWLADAHDRRDTYDAMEKYEFAFEFIENLTFGYVKMDPKYVCLICETDKKGFPSIRISEYVQNLMGTYYSHRSFKDNIPTSACMTCYNDIIKNLEYNSMYVCVKPARSAATIILYSMQKYRPCNEFIARKRLVRLLYDMFEPASKLCATCAANNEKLPCVERKKIGDVSRGRKIPDKLLKILRSAYLKIPFGCNGVDIGDENADRLQSHPFLCQICWSDEIRQLIYEYGKTGEVMIDEPDKMLKKLYNYLSADDRKIILRPASVSFDIDGSAMSNERIGKTIIGFIGCGEDLTNFITPSTYGLKSVSELDKYSKKIFESSRRGARYKYRDTNHVGNLIQSGNAKELIAHVRKQDIKRQLIPTKPHNWHTQKLNMSTKKDTPVMDTITGFYDGDLKEDIMQFREVQLEMASESRVTNHRLEQEICRIQQDKNFVGTITQIITLPWTIQNIIDEYIGNCDETNAIIGAKNVRPIDAICQLYDKLLAKATYSKDVMKQTNRNTFSEHQNPILNPMPYRAQILPGQIFMDAKLEGCNVHKCGLRIGYQGENMFYSPPYFIVAAKQRYLIRSNAVYNLITRGADIDSGELVIKVRGSSAVICLPRRKFIISFESLCGFVSQYFCCIKSNRLCYAQSGGVLCPFVHMIDDSEELYRELSNN